MPTGNPFSGQNDSRRYLAALIHAGMGDEWAKDEANLWWLYARGYRNAAIALTNAVDWRSVHELLYPIGYLFRHHIELKLKELMVRSIALLNLEDFFAERLDSATSAKYNANVNAELRNKIKGHSLAKLWNTLDEWTAAMCSRFSDSEDKICEIQGLLDYIRQNFDKFNQLDADGSTFRYPLDTQHHEILAELYQKNPIIHLGELVDFMQDISDHLEALATMFQIWEEQIGDALLLHEEISEYWEEIERDAWESEDFGFYES